MTSLWKATKARTKRAAPMEPINELRAQIQQLLLRQTAAEQQMARFGRPYPTQRVVEYEDIATVLQTGDQIQLESYRSIPEFNGDKNQYRSWRNQVTRRMGMIENFVTHPKYEAALGIIRSKITGSASDVLTNNKTAYNIHAIIERLDMTYADQRPLYIVEAELTAIKQFGKSLQEFHDEINRALNLVISKIVLTHGNADEQRALIEEAQQKAIRTFIVGLKSNVIRQILYSQNPMTLAMALATAQTVYYDNQYIHLDQNREIGKQKQPNSPKYPSAGTPQQMRGFQNDFNVNVNCNQPRPQQQFQNRNSVRPEPMEVDNSNRYRQETQWRPTYQQPNIQTNGQQKREYNSSRQQLQPPNKVQRINQLRDDDGNLNEGYEEETTDTIPEDQISNTTDETTTASAFLDE